MGNRLRVKVSLLLFLLGAVMSAAGQPARIILIRHAEKPADERDPNLSAEGRARAQRLVTWLSQKRVLGTADPPAALYAAAPSAQGKGVRCLQTLEPAARHLNLPIRSPHRPGEYAKLARHLLRNAALRHRTVVVCWPHEELSGLAAALGARPKPPKWKDRDFDSAYVITFRDGEASLERIKQKPKKNE